MNEVSEEHGMLAAHDSRLATALNEFSQLLQLRRAMKFATEPATAQLMDELAREMATLKLGDPRRAEIVHEIMRFSTIFQQG
jgi:hypothetical protein